MADIPTPASAVAEKFLEPTPFGAKEQYDFSRCTVQLTVTLHPEDGHPKGRLVTLATWTHGDAPIVRVSRRDEMGGGWPAPIKEILTALRAALPQHERIAKERHRIEAERAAKDAAAEAKRKEDAAARRSQAAKSAKSTPKKGTPTQDAPEPKGSTRPAPTTTDLPEPPAAPAAAKGVSDDAQGSLFAEEASPDANEIEPEEEDDDDGQDQV